MTTPNGQELEVVQPSVAYIYTLADPRTGFVRYVGKTLSLRDRLNSHRNDGRRFHKNNWVQSLIQAGLMPIMEVLEEIKDQPDEAWQEAERFWIASLRLLGCNLTNMDSGGLSGKRLSVEARAKLSAAHKGKAVSATTRAKLSVTSRNMSAAARAKISASLRRRPAEIRAAAAAKTRGRTRSPEERAKASASLKGRKFSPSWLESLSKAHIGNRQSAESRRKISESMKGRVRSPEHCANISRSKRLQHAKPPTL